MANIELNIVALGDFSSVTDQITKLRAQIASLNTQLTGSTGAAFDKQAASVASLSNEFQNALTTSGLFTKQTVSMQTETEKFATSLQKGTLGFKNYYQIISGQAGAAMNSVKALALEQTKLQNSVISTDPSKQGFYSVFTPTKIDEVANATKIAANEQNIYNVAVNKGSQALVNWGKNVQWAGRQLTVGMAVPLIVFGQQAVSAFDSVNTALTQLQKVYGEGLTPPSQNSINQISQQVLTLGRNMAATLGISQEFTVQVASQFAAMGKQGNDLLTITEQTDRLAKLGNLDQATATNAVIALQNVYKMNTTQLADAVNYFGAMQKQTSLSMSDLVQSESRIGPIIEELGGTYKDSAVMVLAMKEAGVPAAKSANALKSAMASIINPTSAATKEFASFGINLNNIKDQKGPVNMILALQEALKPLGKMQQEQLIDKLFGKYQFGNITALIQNLGAAGSQTVNALQVANATSSQLSTLANQEIKQATSTPSAQWQKALQTFKADLYPLGQEIIKIGTKLLEFGNKVASVFSGLPGPVKIFIGILAGVTVLAGPLIMLTGLMANFAGQILKGVINFKQLVTGSKTLGQLLTPELIAAQNATDLFSKGIETDVEQVDLLSQSIGRLNEQLTIMIDKLNVGAGIDELKSAVGATAQVETSIFSQMALPGFAEGGIIRGPGTGKSDSILARVSNGETILTEEQTRKNAGVIADIISGKHIPGYKDGLNDLDWSSVEAHTKGNFGPGTPQYEDYLKKNPGIKNPEDSVKLTSDQTATLPSWLNLRLRTPKKINKNSGVNKEDFSAGWDHMQGSQFVNTASRHGVSSSDMEDPEVRKALKDLADGVKNRVMSLDKERVLDEDLAKATKDQIESMKNGTAAERKVAAAIEKAGSTVGQARVNIGTKAVREGVQSGDYTVTNKDGQFSGQEAIGKTGIVRNSDGTAVARISGKSTGGTRVADAKDDTVSSGNWLNPNLEAKAAKKAYSQLEQNLANSLNQESQSHSPSEKTNEAAKNMVDGAVEGLKAGKEPVREAVQDELMLSSYQTPDLTPQVGPRMANGGFYSGEIAPGIMGTQEEDQVSTRLTAARKKLANVTEKVTDKFTKENGKLNAGAKAGIGMALMTGGQMLGSALPSGSVASQAVSNVSTYAGMGAMLGPEGAAVGAAAGLLITAFNAAAQNQREVNNTLKSTYTVSAQAAQAFGLNFQSLQNYDFSKVGKGLADHQASIAANKAAIDALTSAYQQATDQQTKDYLKKVGSADASTLDTMMQQKYSTDRANGLTNDQAMQDITATMQAAGRTSLAIAQAQQKIVKPESTAAAFQQVVQNSLTDTSTGRKYKAGAGQTGDVTYQSATDNNKAMINYFIGKILNDKAEMRNAPTVPTYQDNLAKDQAQLKKLQATNSPTSSINSLLPSSTVTALQTAIMQMISGPASNLGAAFDKLKGTTEGTMVDNKAVFDALNKEITSTVPELSKYTSNLNKGAGGTQALAEATQVYQVAIQGGLTSFDALTKAMSGGPAVMDKFFKSLNWKSLAGQKTDSSGNIINTSTPDPTSTPAAFTGTADEKALKAQLTAKLKSQNANLKIVQDELKQQNKISSEMKAQLDYQQKIQDLRQNAKEAMISGDYMSVASIKQQMSSATTDFNQNNIATGLQNSIDALQSNSDTINQALSDLGDAISNGIKSIDKAWTAANNLPVLKGDNINTNNLGSGTTISNTFHINGAQSPQAVANAVAGHISKSAKPAKLPANSGRTVSTSHPQQAVRVKTGK